MTSTLLSEIDEFLTESGMTEYRFGFLAVKNGRLVERLRTGTTPEGRPVRIWPETEVAVRKFIRSERSKRAKAEQAA